jgi:hypothetical protein
VQLAERAAGREAVAPAGASGSAGAHTFGWRDAMDIIVKWRQLSEPNDQAREVASEALNARFMRSRKCHAEDLICSFLAPSPYRTCNAYLASANLLL